LAAIRQYEKEYAVYKRLLKKDWWLTGGEGECSEATEGVSGGREKSGKSQYPKYS